MKRNRGGIYGEKEAKNGRDRVRKAAKLRQFTRTYDLAFILFYCACVCVCSEGKSNSIKRFVFRYEMMPRIVCAKTNAFF